MYKQQGCFPDNALTALREGHVQKVQYLRALQAVLEDAEGDGIMMMTLI